jgi:hypothetical protein
VPYEDLTPEAPDLPIADDDYVCPRKESLRLVPDVVP